MVKDAGEAAAVPTSMDEVLVQGNCFSAVINEAYPVSCLWWAWRGHTLFGGGCRERRLEIIATRATFYLFHAALPCSIGIP